MFGDARRQKIVRAWLCACGSLESPSSPVPALDLDPLAALGPLISRAVCRLDGMSPLAYVRKIVSTPSTLSRYGGEGRNLGIASASDCDLGDVVRVETWGCSGWITSRETFYIIPGPIHWAGSTSCLLDSTTALPSSRPGQPRVQRLRPRVLPFPGISASRSLASRDKGHQAVPALVIR